MRKKLYSDIVDKIKYTVKINFTCFFFTFFNVAIRSSIITCMTHFLFLLDSTGIDYLVFLTVALWLSVWSIFVNIRVYLKGTQTLLVGTELSTYSLDQAY